MTDLCRHVVHYECCLLTYLLTIVEWVGWRCDRYRSWSVAGVSGVWLRDWSVWLEARQHHCRHVLDTALLLRNVLCRTWENLGKSLTWEKLRNELRIILEKLLRFFVNVLDTPESACSSALQRTITRSHASHWARSVTRFPLKLHLLWFVVDLLHNMTLYDKSTTHRKFAADP